MTNVSRKLIAFIVGLSFALIAFGALAWATSGFRNWNAESWFGYWWGLAKPAATRVAEPPKEQRAMVMTSADNSLTLDSDDAQLTAEVKKFPTPIFKQTENEFYFIVSLSTLNPAPSFDGRSISLSVLFQGVNGGYYEGTLNLRQDSITGDFSFSAKYSKLSRLFEDNIALPSGFYHMFAEVDADEFSGLLGSDALYAYVWIPPFDLLSLNSSIYMDGTTVRVNMPYDYYHGNPFGLGEAVLRRKLVIDIFVGVYGGRDNWIDSTPDYSLNGTGVVSYHDHLEGYINDLSNPFTLHTEVDGNHYYEIDLTKLNFVNIVHPYCAIRVSTLWTKNSPNIAERVPDYIFHPFAATEYTSVFCGHLPFCVEKLSAPQNLTYNYGVLSWDEVQGACGYAVFLGDKSWPVDTNAIDFKFHNIEGIIGEQTFRVRALGNVGQTLAAADNGIELSAFNASLNITQLVTLTYNINGDTVTKFVPLGSKLSDHTYEVKISGKDFGGWYYDDGYSRKVEDTDVLSGDTVIYARLSDKKVVERKATWWDEYMWYVIGGIIGLAVLGIVAAAVVGIRKRKAA